MESLNGAAPKSRLQPRRKAKEKPSRPPEASKWRPNCGQWALFGVAFTGVLSAGLNGYANSQHASVLWAGWAMGLAVPVLVLTLAKVAGLKWRRGGPQRWVGGLAGASGVLLLFLSVWHCALSISLLTGSSVFLSLPMAVAIDLGLVSCEVALISEEE